MKAVSQKRKKKKKKRKKNPYLSEVTFDVRVILRKIQKKLYLSYQLHAYVDTKSPIYFTHHQLTYNNLNL